MSDSEIASLDYRAASLAIREWTMRIASAHVAVAAIIGGAQCFLIWRGLDLPISATPKTWRRSRRNTERSKKRSNALRKAGPIIGSGAPASCAEGKARSEPDAQPVAAAEVSGSPASRSMAAIMPRGSWGTRASARAA